MCVSKKMLAYNRSRYRKPGKRHLYRSYNLTRYKDSQGARRKNSSKLRDIMKLSHRYGNYVCIEV